MNGNSVVAGIFTTICAACGSTLDATRAPELRCARCGESYEFHFGCTVRRDRPASHEREVSS